MQPGTGSLQMVVSLQGSACAQAGLSLRGANLAQVVGHWLVSLGHLLILRGCAVVFNLSLHHQLIIVKVCHPGAVAILAARSIRC